MTVMTIMTVSDCGVNIVIIVINRHRKEIYMGKNIMISEELFVTLYKCFVVDFDSKCETCKGCAEVKRQLEVKGDRIYQHELYTKSKAASTPAERESARQKYLDERGIHPDFRFAQTAFPADDH